MMKTMMRTVLILSVILCACAAFAAGKGATTTPTTAKRTATFDPGKDFISLHYDHAADKDDGHSAAADRTILETLYGADWITKRVAPVSGACGTNRDTFNSESDAVMKAVWDERGGWLAAHDDWAAAVKALGDRWEATLKDGGAIWVKEGGQSDLTAEAVEKIKGQLPGVDTHRRIHVVQHSNWNENKTTTEALAYVKRETDYIRIRDANPRLRKKEGDMAFAQAAAAHPVFGPGWKAAFDYLNPGTRLDFSDTGELLYIVGLGEMNIDAFRQHFLPTPAPLSAK